MNGWAKKELIDYIESTITSHDSINKLFKLYT